MGRDDEKKDVYTVVENFSLKKIFRYRVLLIFLFLIFAGIISYIVLTSEAEKLAGEKRYQNYSESRGLKGFGLSIIEKLKYAFAAVTEKNADNKKVDLTNSDYKNEYNDEKGEDGIHKSSKGIDGGIGDGGSKTSHYFSSAQTGIYKKSALESSLSQVAGEMSQLTSQTSLSGFDSYASAKVKIGQLNSKVGLSYGKKNENDKTAMGLLKSTFKTTVMAARDASNDTARAWTSKSFDYTPDIKQTIEYDENLRASLDRINPNSIPAFLKDPALDPESMKSLKVSEVPGLSSEENSRNNFDIDINDIKNQMNEYNENKNKLLGLNNVSNLNPLFNMQGTSGDNELSEEEIDQKSYSVNTTNPNVATSPQGEVVTSPSSPPDLGKEISNVTTDEYGYIRVTQNDGSIQIFDPDSGKIVGCEIPSDGMCLLPGADNCPKDVYFT